MRRPATLRDGARVALVCPAGPLRGEEDLRRAEANAACSGVCRTEDGWRECEDIANATVTDSRYRFAWFIPSLL